MELNYKMLSTDSTVEIQILDFIGDGGVTLQDILDGASQHKGKDAHVLINSAGGSVMEGISIFNYLKSNFKSVTTEVIGYGASIASIIFMAGDKRIMREGTLLFLHNPWTVLAGNSKDLRTEADTLDKVEEQLISIYSNGTAMLPNEIKTLLDEETWLSAQEALDMGFATEIDGVKQRAVAHLSKEFVARVKNIPEALKLEVEEKEVPLVEASLPAQVEDVSPETKEVAQEHKEEISAMADAIAPQVIPEISNMVKVNPETKFAKYGDFFNALGNSGYTPKEVGEIYDVMAEQNPMRQVANVVKFAGDGIISYAGIASASFGADGATLTPTDPTLGSVTVTGWNLQGVFTVTDALMNDDFYNVNKLITQSIGGAFAEGEVTAMLGTGDGTAGPQGIFNKTADVTTAVSATISAQEFLDFEASLETKWRDGNEVFILHPTTLAKIAGLADSSKKIELDRTAKTINGIKYIISSKAPAFAANTSVIALGNFKHGYVIADRGYGVQVKRVDSATAFSQNVLFGVKVDGKIVNPSAFKILKAKL
jgi:ATP-dependent Clp protease, protease subunit